MDAKVYVTRMLPRAAMDALGAGCGYDVNEHPRPVTREELIEGVRGREAVLCMLSDRIDAEVLRAAGPQCKIFANYAVGYDNIDVAEAKRLGIMVANTPDVLTCATADMAWALLFAAARHIPAGDRLMRAGTFAWAPEFMLGSDITGRTLGVVGPGRIGRDFARKARHGFDMTVLYSGRHPSPEFEAQTDGRFVSLEELLRSSDFISLHVPLTPETRHMIGERELAMMKPSAILVNTSRGPVVDEAALARALKDGTIRAAGLDVYEREPEVEPMLKELDNVALAPHLGSATIQTRLDMGLMAVRNILAALKGEEPPNRVA
ncbi:MAG: D-glycerate dehydrogenase [Synergistaceae bacterium]|nr:D-glycerate dehydrogenase [Synergistaceae bacterium]